MFEKVLRWLGLVCFALLVIIQSSQGGEFFNASDPKWKISDRFAPDKTQLWKYPIAVDGWTLAHDALRGEIRDFGEALGALNKTNTVTDEQIKATQNWWKGHYIHLASHHRNEDKIVQNFVRKRFVYPEFMVVDHDGILEHMKNLDEMISRDLPAVTSQEHLHSLLDRLCALWKAYSDDLVSHLKAEEDSVIPLLRAYFTPKEVQRLTRRLTRAGPAVETGSIVHYVGKDKMKASMKRQDIPGLLAKTAWLLILNPRLEKYQRSMLRQLDIMNGR